MIDSLKCFFGFHDWTDTFMGNQYGHRCGDRCQRPECGVWSKDSKITEYKSVSEAQT